MTTTHNPDELRAEIDQTRANLSQNVNALGEAVTPGNIARRQADKARGAAVGVKDKVMGSAEDTASHVSGSVGDAGQSAKARAQGNPLAAGVIALGAGWLLGSLLPATSKEQQAATALKDQAAPLIDQAQALGKDAAHDMADQLKEPARDAADSVRTTAQEAAHHVQAEGQSAAHDVTTSAQESRNKLA
jgi:hypothetical protein